MRIRIQNINAVEEFVAQRKLTEEEKKKWSLTFQNLLKDTETVCSCLESNEICIEYYPADKHHEFAIKWLNGNGIPLKIGTDYFLLTELID